MSRAARFSTRSQLSTDSFAGSGSALRHSALAETSPSGWRCEPRGSARFCQPLGHRLKSFTCVRIVGFSCLLPQELLKIAQEARV